MTAQLDLFTTGGARSVTLPGWGRVLLSERDAWMAKYTGPRWGWVVYRATPTGWESWEPDLPFGQSYLHERAEAERILDAAAARYGDSPLALP